MKENNMPKQPPAQAGNEPEPPAFLVADARQDMLRLAALPAIYARAAQLLKKHPADADIITQAVGQLAADLGAL